MSVDATMRVFFALWPTSDAAAHLSVVARNWHDRLGGRVMREDSLHATLVFIGDVAMERLPAIQAVAGNIQLPGLTLVFEQAGCWHHNHIAYLGMRQVPDALLQLQLQLTTQLKTAGFTLETREFNPHITLLRKADCGKMQMESPVTESVAWPVRDFVLVKSSLSANGSRYEQIGQWPLL